MKFIDYRKDSGKLNLPLKDLPNLKRQRRKQSAKSSLNPNKICGADTETVDGKVWLFSSEFGVWEIDSMRDLIDVLWNDEHASKWKQGRGKNQKTSRGLSTKEFFFWNLKFDGQAVMKLCSDEEIDSILNGDETEVKMDGGSVKIKYLQGKFMSFKPVNMKIGQYKLGKCVWWDISQFYGKMRLNHAAQQFLNSSKIETCFDGSVLDAGRFSEKEYRDYYREDIEKYAVQDAILAGRLARMKRNDFVNQDVRFIQPYSVANVAQRNMMDLCKIPTLNNFKKHPQGLREVLDSGPIVYASIWFLLIHILCGIYRTLLKELGFKEPATNLGGIGWRRDRRIQWDMLRFSLFLKKVFLSIL
jgi:hypothetical protein